MKRILFRSIVLLICLPAFAQQPDVNRFTLFTGFDYMVSPARNLTERGFESDFGVTLRPWLALGADFSAIGDGIVSGAGTINGGETIYAPALISAAGLGLPVPPPSAISKTSDLGPAKFKSLYEYGRGIAGGKSVFT